ncbi:MAG: hypothetical protein AAFP17_05495 [Pseudomonadota bacterium]
MKLLAMRAVVAALMMVMVSSAAEALVLRIDFEASGGGLFTDPAIGTVVLEVEPGVNVSNAPVISSSFNFGPISDVVFDVFSNGSAITVGGLGNADRMVRDTDDFQLLIFNVFDNPSFVSFDQIGAAQGFGTTATVTGSVTAVPLPPAALLLLAGLGALSLTQRRSART